MYITIGDLTAYCGVSTWCLRAYLDRGEFNKCRTNKKYLWNMSEEQMEHLKELVHNLKRRFICIEKDYDYWKASVERLEREQAQLKLF